MDFTDIEINATADRIVLSPKSPSYLFVFWQWTKTRCEAFSSGAIKPEVQVRLFYSDDRSQASEHVFRWDEKKAYLKVPSEGRSFFAALYIAREDNFEKLAESNLVTTPVSCPAAEASAYSSSQFQKKVLS